MTTGEALFLGVVQGLAEFLPVSSSGHLVLVQSLFQIEASLLFDVFLHSATLGAVLVFFWNDIVRITRKELSVLVVGTLPVVLVGLLLKDTLEMAFASPLLVGVTLLITGSLNMLSHALLQDAQQQPRIAKIKAVVQTFISRQKLLPVSISQALVIGAAQAVAVTPGISRSGSTVVAGLVTGLDRHAAFRFSFLLSIPAILGATLLQVIDAVSSGEQFPSLLTVIVGCLAAFVVGLISLRLLKYLMDQAQLQWFGWYCFAIGLLVIGLQLS